MDHEHLNPFEYWTTEEATQGMTPPDTEASAAPSPVGSRYEDESDDEIEINVARYPMHVIVALEQIGTYLYASTAGMNPDSIRFSEMLCVPYNGHPRQTPLFDGDFVMFVQSLMGEGRFVLREHLTPLLVPRALESSIQARKEVMFLDESVGDAWTGTAPGLIGTPRPDYSLGFSHGAFTAEQHHLLETMAHRLNPGARLPYAGTRTMFFPFLVTEVVSGLDSLDVADCKNACSMTTAIMGANTVLPFRIIDPHLDRQVMGFSISHNDQDVRIYAYYIEFKDGTDHLYRHTVRRFNITDRSGRDRTTAHDIVMRIYRQWIPLHLFRLRSAINTLMEANNDIEKHFDSLSLTLPSLNVPFSNVNNDDDGGNGEPSSLPLPNGPLAGIKHEDDGGNGQSSSLPLPNGPLAGIKHEDDGGNGQSSSLPLPNGPLASIKHEDDGGNGSPVSIKHEDDGGNGLEEIKHEETLPPAVLEPSSGFEPAMLMPYQWARMP